MGVVIVDYGMGNVASILNMLKKVGTPARISNSPDEIMAAERLILPGVGAFDAGMRNLEERGLPKLLEAKVHEGTPILGICLGMQLMTRGSEEGGLPGLGWVNARTVRFRLPPGYRVPHMGWNEVRFADSFPLGRGLGPDSRFYFVHGYHVQADDLAEIGGTSEYGGEFTAAIRRQNVLGVQFHPEKSHNFGMQLLRNFVEDVA